MDRYEKALELARAYYDKDANAFLDTIFPELKESRDEQIRKAIIKSLDMPFPEDNLPGTDVAYKEAVAWLEKQKENPKLVNSISSDCASSAKCEDRWYKVTDFLPDNGREVLAKDKLGNTLLARYDGEGWDVSVYDDEDYRCHNGISKWCEIPSEKQKEHFRDDTKMVKQ